jgi:7-carboxy-7-deazaguanine synthase
MEENQVKLIEFFRSFQGEGVDRGRSMIILRFKYCNKNCSFCDTNVKMRISQEGIYNLKDIQKTIDKYKCGILVTGGEPTIKKHFDECLLLLNELNYPIANVETNGYNLLKLIPLVDPEKLINYSYSPKIFNETDLENEMNVTKKLIKYPNVYFKVVYENREDVLYYLDWLSKLNVNQRTYLMIEGTTRVDLIRNSGAVFDACEEYKFNFSSRDHIIYGFI